MHRGMALLAGLLLATQVAAQPVAAAEPHTIGTDVLAQTEKAPNRPGGPGRPDDLTAGPMADLKVVLVSGVWQGNQRHSTFEVSNIGDHTAKNVSVRKWIDIAEFDSDPEQEISYQKLGDLAPGAVHVVNVVCVPPESLDQCIRNGAQALSISSDKNPTDNSAKDEV